jgi:DNA (cytosine-5)-methyltransferase 1
MLDLFCGAGGVAKGYADLGFRVIGVDIDYSMLRSYPYECYHLDAMMLLNNLLLPSLARRLIGWNGMVADDFAAIHASPPCQFYSDLAKRNPDFTYPDLIPDVRRLLQLIGKPYIIENVDNAPLRNPTLLCGTMFNGLRVLRHRLFETNFPVQPRAHPKHPHVFTHDKRKAHYGRMDQTTSFVQVTGGGNCLADVARDAMGISWMSKSQLNEAIPPAYSNYIGRFIPLTAQPEAAKFVVSAIS